MFKQRTAIAELAFHLGELDTEVRKLKTAHKHLELEWEELYDKVRHQMSRISRRVKADEKAAGNGLDPEPPPGAEASLDPISERILRRRAGFSADPI